MAPAGRQLESVPLLPVRGAVRDRNVRPSSDASAVVVLGCYRLALSVFIVATREAQNSEINFDCENAMSETLRY